MASIGESLAARRAGNTPNKIPIPDETPKATITATKFKLAGKKNLIPQTINAERARPTIPPSNDNTTDSVKNWSNTSFSVAPIARLIPISFVLSVTVAYIIFIIPIPPTNREIEPMAIRIELIIPNI